METKILIFPIFAVLISVVLSLPHDAYGFNAIVTDQASCLALPATVLWDDTNKVCQLGSTLTLTSTDTLTVNTGFQLGFVGGISGDAFVGTLDNSGTVTFNGIVQNAVLGGFGGGPRTGNINNNNGGTININGDGVVNDGTITNNLGGTINDNSLSPCCGIGNNFDITNDGTINIMSGGVDNSAGILNNVDGVININAGSFCNCGSSNFNNLGKINIKSGARLVNGDFSFTSILTNRGTIINAGIIGTISSSTINNAPGGTIENDNGGIISNNSGGNFNNLAGAAINNLLGGTIDNHEFITNAGSLTDSGALNHFGDFSGTFTDSGTLTITGTGTLTNSGPLSITSGAQLVNSGYITSTTGGPITNDAGGTITNNHIININSRGSIANAGTFTNSGPFTVDFGGTFSNSGAFTSNVGDTVDIDGLLTNTGSFTNGGTSDNRCDGTISTTGTFANSGTLDNSGTITGAISGNAVVAVTCVAPPPPTSLTATPVTPFKIDLSWTAPVIDLKVPGSAPVHGYKIERDSGSGFVVIIPDTGTTATTFSNIGLAPSTSFSYRVSAINGISSSPSAPATATTLALNPHTTLTLRSSPNPSVFGQSVSFTAAVDAVDPLSGTPTGSVQFFEGTTLLGTGDLSEGPAVFSTSSLSIGTHSITASYPGDTTFIPNKSTAISQVVLGSNTITLTSSANPSNLGQSVTFQVTVAAAPPASGTPTGTVEFSIDGTVTQVPLTAGAASLTTSSLSKGTHSINVRYLGDSNFGQNGKFLSQVVQGTPTTTSISSDSNPSTVGFPVKFTATVSPSTATGSVTFTIDGTDQPAISLSAGKADFTDLSLLAGTHHVTASYSGDTNFAPSTSADLAQLVNAPAIPDYKISASPSSISIAPSQTQSSSITIQSLNGFTDTVNLAAGWVGATGAPSGVTGKFSPPSVAPSSGGISKSTLSLTTTGSPSTGGFTLEITGTSSAGITHTADITVNISAQASASSPACTDKTGAFVDPAVLAPTLDPSDPTGNTGDSPDGKSKVTISHISTTAYLTLTRLSDNNQIVQTASNPAAWGYSPDGRFFVLASSMDGTSHHFDLAVYDIKNAKLSINLGTVYFATGAAEFKPEDDGQDSGTVLSGDAVSTAGWGFSPDGKTFVFGKSDPFSATPGYELNLYNSETGNNFLQSGFAQDFSTFWQFSPSGDVFMWVRQAGTNPTTLDPVTFYYTADSAKQGQQYKQVFRQVVGSPSATVESTGTNIILTAMSAGSIPNLTCSASATAHSPVNIVAIDSSGLRTGFDPSTGGTINQIPGSTYTGPGSEPQTIALPYSLDGYSIEAFGLGSLTLPQTFHVTFATDDSSGQSITNTDVSGTASAGSFQSFTFNLDNQGIVTASSKGASTTSLSSSSNPSISGQSVTFTDTVSPSTATGTVTFTIDGTAQPAVSLSGGKATLTSSSLSVGTHQITASYGGDGNFGASVGSLSQAVTILDTTPPTITGTPSDITVHAKNKKGIVVTYTTPTATDPDDGSVPVTCTPPSGSTFPIGTTTVTCTATDPHGNSASTTFHVIVTHGHGHGEDDNNEGDSGEHGNHQGGDDHENKKGDVNDKNGHDNG